MKKIMFRILFSLLFALPFILVTSAWAQADAPAQTAAEDLDCQSCHPAFYTSWEHSHHGQAFTDSTFKESWQAQGEPTECLACHTTGYDPLTNTWLAENITCEACHSPISETHPNSPMPTNRSSTLCGRCHTETYFEWQVSTHRLNDLDCVDCHGQHSTSLKAEDANALCASCHRDQSSNYAHTAHSGEGLTCADCHLVTLDGDLGEGHAFRDHSFNVQLSACNACHAYDMHDPAEVHTTQADTTDEHLDAMASVETLGVSLDPDPVSPVYFILLAALIGMAFGLLLAPWIERWYRRNVGIDHESKK